MSLLFHSLFVLRLLRLGAVLQYNDGTDLQAGGDLRRTLCPGQEHHFIQIASDQGIEL